MSNISLKKWRVYCETEMSWSEGWLEGDAEPTKCFNNSSHDINVLSKNLLEETSKQVVSIQQEAVPTGGNYKTEMYSFVATAGTTTIYPVSWPFPVTASSVHLFSEEDEKGNVFNVVVSPETVVGVILQNLPIGSTSTTVNSTVIAVAKIGYEVIINSEFLGRIISIDSDNFTIIFENATQVEHNLNSPFKLQHRIISNYLVGYLKNPHSIGVDNLTGKYLKANTITNCIYTNNTVSSKTCRFIIDYLF
jgi:hypothetical protein